jgi:TRAP-type C4-dicarboxylate transport system permease small subunit
MNESTGTSPRRREWFRYLHLAADVVVIGVAMALFFYGTFDACEWALRDFSHASGIPRERIAEVLKKQRGANDPGWSDCFQGWIHLKTYGLPPSVVRLINK